MKKVFKDSNEEMFETFLIKEREKEEIDKLHAQETIKYMAKCFEEEQNKATIFTRIKWFLFDIIDNRKLKKIKEYNENRVNSLSNEDKCNKELQHKVFTRKDFKIHIFLNQILTERTTIADCGGITYPYLCYEVYMQIEYSELLTRKQDYKELEKIKDAEHYYNELLKYYKNQSIKDIINNQTEEIDKHCAELKNRIEFFKNN